MPRKMDELITIDYLASSKYIAEKASFLELTTYPESNIADEISETKLDHAQIKDWICQEKEFATRPPSSEKTATLRLLIQETHHPSAFAKNCITIPQECWAPALEHSIINAKAFELATCPGLLLWTDIQLRDSEPILEIVLQWGSSSKHSEHNMLLSLSHNITTSCTNGYYKCTPRDDPTDYDPATFISRLKRSLSQLTNPFLLPSIILHDELSHIEDRQRDIRRQVRRIEDALGLRNGLQAGFNPFGWAEGVVDFEYLNREIVETGAQLQKRKPGTYTQVLGDLERAMFKFDTFCKERDAEVRNGNEDLKSRVRFQLCRIKAMERYFEVTNARLNAQINALYNLIAQKDNKLNYLVAMESRKVAAASKYESSAMRTISILGVVFLPGTFVASILSTSFFDFQVKNAGEMSERFWIYWAITIPLTLLVLAAWVCWYYTNKRSHEAMDRKLEETMPSAAIRRVGTWPRLSNSGNVVRNKGLC